MAKQKFKYRAVISFLSLLGQTGIQINDQMLVWYDEMSSLRAIMFQWVSESEYDRIDPSTNHPPGTEKGFRAARNM
jgi:hypothetical protein